MKPSQIYRKAAELVDARDEFECSCMCIEEVMRRRNAFGFSLEAETYDAIFSPDGDKPSAWGLRWDSPQQCRVLALLLMSEIAKDSEK